MSKEGAMEFRVVLVFLTREVPKTGSASVNELAWSEERC
jgi:hypothetical protein